MPEGSSPRRPLVMARHHAVAAGHPLAAQAGLAVLEAGGNAIDAGVAVGLATGVLESQLVGIAGIAPILIHLAAERRVVAVSGVGGWPAAASAELFRDRHGGVIDGVLSTVVPGGVDGWLTSLEAFGTMTFAEVAAPAIALAREGFPMYPLMARQLAEAADKLRRWPSSAAIYLPGGRPPGVGEVFRQVDIARTLGALADAEAAARGDRAAGIQAARRLFYDGDIAAMACNFLQEEGGLLTREDMAGFRAAIEPPATGRFREFRLFTGGPYGQGPSMIQVLQILAGDPLEKFGHNSSAYVHLLVEAIKLVAADRALHFGDPRMIEIPLATLLSDAHAVVRRAMIEADRAFPDMPVVERVGGPAWPDERDRARGSIADPAVEPDAYDTSYFAVIDRAGNVFSATPSDGARKSPVVPGLGLVISTRGLASFADPDHPNGIAPGRRPLLTNGPALAFARDGSCTAFGSPGNDVQLQAMLQVFCNIHVFGMDPQSAVEAPRFASYSFPAAFYPHGRHPGRVRLEGRIDAGTGEALAAQGHDVVWWSERDWRAGSMCVIRRDAGTAVLTAAADPRRTAYALGW